MKGLLGVAVFFFLFSIAEASVQGEAKAWQHVIQQDPLDEKVTIKLGTTAIVGNGHLVIFCEGYFVEMVVVQWSTYLGFEPDSMKYKIDDGPIVDAHADAATGGRAAIFKDVDVLDDLKKGKRLAVRAEYSGVSESKTLVFNLDGLDDWIESRINTTGYCSITL